MNVRLVYVSADHKGMIAFGKSLGKFHTQPVSFFRSNLAGAEGLAHMIGNHVICTAHSSGSGNVLPLCQKELCIRSPAVTRIAGNELAVICFLWICYIVDDVTDCPTFCPAFADMKRHDSSAQIKAAEKRMAEIAVLRTHIVNYAKTREVYVAYRKAGYSRKFREEHEEEILLHQAAKNAFDEMGVKKLPKVKDLQAEYSKPLEEKKKTYAEYRRSREEMRELLTAKANVDRVLNMDEEQKKEQEKDHGQR